MNKKHKPAAVPYTCNEYRQEMIILSLRHRLQQNDLTRKDREKLTDEIKRLEEKAGF